MAKLCDLPEEVLEQIMLRLPPESLIQFKQVCKPWYVLTDTLINDAEFVAKHLRNSKNDVVSSPISYYWKLLAISHPESEDKESDVEGNHLFTMATHDLEVNDCIPCVNEDLKFLVRELHQDSFKLVSHCDGILCLYAHYRKEFISLLNPALKEFKVVLNSCLDDNFSIDAVGFGHDSRANDYKIVIIKSVPGSIEVGPHEAEIYTLSTNSWKEIEFDVEIYDFPYDEQTLYCNGVYYWYLSLECRIISFDFGNEVFHDIPLPDNVVKDVIKFWEHEERSKVAVWNDSVVLFLYVEEDLAFDMWVMDAYSGGVEGSYFWTKYRSIGPLRGVKRPVAFWNNDVLFLETKDSEIMSCDIHAETINEFPIPLVNFRSDRFIIYTRSLVSVLKREGKSSIVEAIHRSSGPPSS